MSDFWGDDEAVAVIDQDEFCRKCGGRGIIRGVVRYKRNEQGRLPRGASGEIILIPDEVHVIDFDVKHDDLQSVYPMPLWEEIVSPCECVIQKNVQRRIQRLLGDVNIPDDVKGFEFKDFERIPHALDGLAFVRELVDTGSITFNGRTRFGVMLVGGTGSFKTSLAYVAFRTRLLAGDSGGWVKFKDLVEKMRATYKSDYSGPTKEEMIDVIKTAKFSVLDDLGSTTQQTLWAEDAINAVVQIAEYRLNLRLPTIITTNLTKEQLYDQFGAQAISRVKGLCQGVIMHGKDYRVQ